MSSRLIEAFLFTRNGQVTREDGLFGGFCEKPCQPKMILRFWFAEWGFGLLRALSHRGRRQLRLDLHGAVAMGEGWDLQPISALSWSVYFSAVGHLRWAQGMKRGKDTVQIHT